MWAAGHADWEAWGRGRGEGGQAGPRHAEGHVTSSGSHHVGATSSLQLWVCLSRAWSLVTPYRLIFTPEMFPGWEDFQVDGVDGRKGTGADPSGGKNSTNGSTDRVTSESVGP